MFLQKDEDVENTKDFKIVEIVQDVQTGENVEDVQIVQNDEKYESVEAVKNIILEVPFVLQAPFANWSDPIFEDACEEAAILMTDGWLKGKTFTNQEAYDEIKKIVEIEKEELGEYIDASADDTAEIMKLYSGVDNIEVETGISVEDIILEISQGNLVIVPTNGKKLGNSNYTPPGPITHMIVIIGYDVQKNQFITNDSGTKNGKGFRYDEDILFEAIRDYPTGDHYENPIDESVQSKSMIIVDKEL